MYKLQGLQSPKKKKVTIIGDSLATKTTGKKHFARLWYTPNQVSPHYYKNDL